MKKLILFAVVALLATGCATSFRTSHYINNRVKIGMPVAEFKKLAGENAKLDAMTTDHTTYRIDHSTGSPHNRYVYRVTLYHFDSQGRLTEIETRDLAPGFFQHE